MSIGKYTLYAYPNDHTPRHVHAFEGNEVEVIIDLRHDGSVGIADRTNAFRPKKLTRGRVKKILRVAAENFDALAALWEEARGR